MATTPEVRPISGYTTGTGRVVGPGQGVRHVGDGSDRSAGGAGAGAASSVAQLGTDINPYDTSEHDQWWEDVSSGMVPPSPIQCPDGITRTGYQYVNPNGSPGGFIEYPEPASGFDTPSTIGSGVHLDPEVMLLAGTSVGDGSKVYGNSTLRDVAMGPGCEARDTNAKHAVIENANLVGCNIEVADRNHWRPEDPQHHAYINLDMGEDRLNGVLVDVNVKGPAAIVKSEMEGCNVTDTSVEFPATHRKGGREPWQSDLDVPGMTRAEAGERRTLVHNVRARDSRVEDAVVQDLSAQNCAFTSSRVSGHEQSDPYSVRMGEEALVNTEVHGSMASISSGDDLYVSGSRFTASSGSNLTVHESSVENSNLRDGAVRRSSVRDVDGSMELSTVDSVKALKVKAQFVAKAPFGTDVSNGGSWSGLPAGYSPFDAGS